MFSPISLLLRVAKMVLQQVMQGLGQQLNVVREQAAAPMQAAIEEVTGGVWRGVGADAFVEEVSSLELPGVGVIGDQIGSLASNLQRAQEIMEEADKKANQQVRSIDELFRRIVTF
jgi:uncharacterized protein YukE